MSNSLYKYTNSSVEDMRLSGGLSATFDGFGNVLIYSNETCLSASVITVDLYNPRFSTEAIMKNVKTEFSEFFNTAQTNTQVSSQADTQVLYTNQVAINKDLQSKLDSLTIELNNPDKLSTDMQIKDIITELRIKLGQGSVAEDFSTVFPYEKIN